MKLTGFLYGLLLVLMVFSIYTLYWTDIFTGSNTTIPQSQEKVFAAFNQTNEMFTQLNDSKNKAINIKEPSGSWVERALDFVGFYFKSGIELFAIIPTSLNMVTSLTGTLLDSSSGLLGIAFEPLKKYILLFVIVAIVFGVIASTLLQREL